MPGTDPFLYYVDETEKRLDLTNARTATADEILKAHKPPTVNPADEPPPRPPEPGQEMRRPPERNPYLDYPVGPISTITGKPLSPPVDVVASHELPPGDTALDTLRKGGQNIVGGALQGVGGFLRNAGESLGIDSGVDAVAGALDRVGLKNPGIEAYRKSMQSLRNLVGLDAAFEPVRAAGESLGAKGSAINQANLPSYGTPYLQEQVQSAIGSSGLSLTALGLSFVTKNPMLGLSIMGAASGGQQYGASREFGHGGDWARVGAGLNAAVEIVTERLPLEKFLEAGEETAKKNIVKALKDGFQAQGLDIGGELLATLGQDVISIGHDRPNLTTAELVSDLKDTFWSTLFMGPIHQTGAMALGGAQAIVTKSDTGPSDFQGYVEQHFPGSTVELNDHGANVTLPSGKKVEIHTPTSPQAEQLAKDAKISEKTQGTGTQVAGVYFKVGDTTVTDQDVIYLTGQGTDLTTLPHEKAHLVVNSLTNLLTPEELEAIGLPASGQINPPTEEAVATAFEEYAYKRTPSQENPLSPLDKAFQKVIDFAHEAYSVFGGDTQRTTFEKMRSGEVLTRKGAPRLPGESEAQYQRRTEEPAWLGPIKSTKSGRVIGSPPSHQSPQAREGMIRKMVNSATAMHKVNPDQAHWYERAGESIRTLFGIHKDETGQWVGNTRDADVFMRALALWSARMPVERNVKTAIEVMFRLAEGKDAGIAGAVSSAETMAERFPEVMAAARFSQDLPGVGPNIDSFYWDIHNAVYQIPDERNATIDTHVIGWMDLRKENGEPYESLRGPQYGWARSAVEEATKRFNKANGTDYSARQVQALGWEWNRVGRVAVKEENEDFAKYLGVGILTGETVPATNSDVATWLHSQGYTVKKAFSDHVLKVLYGENGQDVILERLQVPQGGDVPGLGTYEGAVNPNLIKTALLRQSPLGDFDSSKLNLYADIFGYVFTQNAVPWYRTIPSAAGDPAFTQGVSIRRTDGPLVPSLAGQFYGILKSKIPGAELTHLGDEFHVINFMGLDVSEFQQRMVEAANEFEQKAEVDTQVGGFGAEGQYRTSDADGAARWSGKSYRDSILAAGGHDLLSWADSLRERALAAAGQFGAAQEVTVAGAKFQARIKDIHGNDITPAIKAAAYSQAIPVRSVGPLDRIWLLDNGNAIPLEYFEIHASRADKIIAAATSEPVGRRIPLSEFGGAIGAIRFHGEQFNPFGPKGSPAPSLNFEVYGPLSKEQSALLEKSIGSRRYLLSDITDPSSGEVITFVAGQGREGFKELQKTVKKAFGGGAKFQEKSVQTPHGEFPLDFNGWKFEGQWPGAPFYQYTNKNPDSPSYRTTILVDRPENLKGKAEAADRRFTAAKTGAMFQVKKPMTDEELERLAEDSVQLEEEGAFRKWSPSFRESRKELVKKIQREKEAADARLEKYLSTQFGPKFQTRTPGPKGMTVNFSSPETNAMGEELMRSVFVKVSREQTNDQSLRLAQEMIGSGKMSLDTFLQHDPNTGWPDTAHAVAADMIAGGVFDYVQSQLQLAKDGQITKEQGLEALFMGMTATASWYGPASEVGRMLQARQIVTTPTDIPVADFMKEQYDFTSHMADLIDKGLIGQDELIVAATQFYSMEQLNAFRRRVVRIKEPSLLNQLFYFSLLSNPVTQAANIVGNLGPVFFAIGEEYLSEKMPFSATPKGGAAGMAAGLYHGLLDSLILSGRAAYTGESSFRGGKYDSGNAPTTGIPTIDQAREEIARIKADPTHPFNNPDSDEYATARRDVMLLHRKAWNPISGDRLNRLTSGNMDATGYMGRTLDVLGEMVDGPFKGLTAGDEFFKTIAYRMSIWGRAYQMGAAQGLEGDDFNQFVARFVDDPPAADHEIAMEFARKQTFTNEPGKIGQAMMSMTREYPALRLVVPFVGVISNIGRYNLERMPVANLLLRSVRADIAAGGKARDMALAKTAMGAAVAGAFAVLAGAGMMTGSGPSDPEKKKLWIQQGWQEYSFKIDGTYYSYKRLEPFATPLGVVADVVEMSRFAPDFDLDEGALVAALSFIRNFTSKTYMSGVSQLLDVVVGGGEDTLVSGAARWAKTTARLAVPGGIAQASKVIDPVKRDAQNWIDAIKERIPGLSSSLMPVRNLKGEPVTNAMYETIPGKLFGMINPIYWTAEKEDPVSQEILANRMKLTMPARSIGGGQDPDKPQLDQGDPAIPLTPEQYDWLVRMAGNELKDPDTGLGAWDTLRRMVTNRMPIDTVDGKDIFYRDFSPGPEGGRAYVFKKVIGSYRTAARKMLEGGEAFPELGTKYERKKERRGRQLMPRVGQ